MNEASRACQDPRVFRELRELPEIRDMPGDRDKKANADLLECSEVARVRQDQEEDRDWMGFPE